MIFGIYVAGDSGAYLNPAITLTNCLFRGLPLRRWPVYAAAQLLGAFCGHGLVYANCMYQRYTLTAPYPVLVLKSSPDD